MLGMTPQDDEFDGAAGHVMSSPPRRGLWVVVVTVAVVLFSGWAYWDWTRSSQGPAQVASSTQLGPITEYPPDARGESVVLSGGSLTDTRLDIADLRGDAVVINVWGSWCAPCREEAPVLSRLSREYADSGVSFLGVDVKDNRAAALAFEDEFDIAYPSIEDRDGRALLALSSYVPAQAVPVTLVLDRDGRVAGRIIGASKEGTLRALIEGVLEERADEAMGSRDG